ncbi:hypothetical protein OsI_27600 [Oryza sativa Indica Group]|uniref:Uncharacterized protein n=3 Tax=Oryza TaxID=4527 RepID=A3BP22_ORYSJ|nr:hypothetical protein OsI_27600 [Oryza sativa Indica Group]EAZ41311.1 hypothetical protein OsJ_25821 [Oryza sativa Japonica Group]
MQPSRMARPMSPPAASALNSLARIRTGRRLLSLAAVLATDPAAYVAVAVAGLCKVN